MNEISRTLTVSHDVQQSLATIHEQVGRLYDAANFYIATYSGGEEWSLDYQLSADNRRRQPGTGLAAVSPVTSCRRANPSSSDRCKTISTSTINRTCPRSVRPPKSWMGVPLIVGGNIIGVMGIQTNTQEGLYAEQDVALFSTISTQVAAAIQNVRLFQEARLRANELAALNELSRTLASQLGVQQVLNEVWHGVSHLLDTTNFYIALYDAERQEVSFPINASESVLDKEITVMPANQGLTSYYPHQTTVADQRRCQCHSQPVGPEKCRRHFGVVISGYRLRLAIRCWAWSPFKMTLQPACITNTIENLLLAIAGQTAIALQNARLFEQVQRTAKREQTLRELTARVRSSGDPDTIVRTAVRELGLALGRPTFIRLGNAEH